MISRLITLYRICKDYIADKIYCKVYNHKECDIHKRGENQIYKNKKYR